MSESEENLQALAMFIQKVSTYQIIDLKRTIEAKLRGDQTFTHWPYIAMLAIGLMSSAYRGEVKKVEDCTLLGILRTTVW